MKLTSSRWTFFYSGLRRPTPHGKEITFAAPITWIPFAKSRAGVAAIDVIAQPALAADGAAHRR
ncbi:MAG: hypothetical protein AB1689_06420 [Thermodesulfobacteriota bacterium]